MLGADQWAVFDTWREPEEILRLIPVAVAARPGSPSRRATSRCSRSSSFRSHRASSETHRPR